MNIVRFEDVKKDIMYQMKDKKLIPILGAGFTKGCKSRHGNVPDADEYRKNMINEIINKRPSDTSEKELDALNFSAVSSIYHKIIDEKIRNNYLRANFIGVELEQVKKDFLNIDWMYIYTLNIDDAIENNSDYNMTLYANRDIRDSILDQEKCVIKLHGDINDMLKFKDSKCEIFDQAQYVVSIKENEHLLKRVKHDYEFLNLIYIGCSLNDEIDIMFSTAIANDNMNYRYYCTNREPNFIERMSLENYGITDCIVFDSYDEIYQQIVDAYDEALKIAPNELEKYSTYEFSDLKIGFDLNNPYLFHGKSVLKKDNTAIYPNFFISREITDKIINNLNKKSTQIVIGRGCSGKTYVFYDLIRRTRGREVFAFGSKNSINNETLQILLKKERCLIVFDSKVLSVNQIEKILASYKERTDINNSIVIIESKTNRDLDSILTLMRSNNNISEDDIPIIDVSNKLSEDETCRINNLLIKSTLGVFYENKTIADNIINASETLIHKNCFSNIALNIRDYRHVACLIMLATKEKVYVSDAVNLDLIQEFETQCKCAAPLIERECAWYFERTAANNSPLKYVVNAEFWLFHKLDELANDRNGRELIIKSYQYIISKLVEINGKPDLLKLDKKAPYKEYIMFDNIFQIFSSQGTPFVRDIYQSLNEMLAADPDYLHQRAKCYLRSAYKERNVEKQIDWLELAHRDASMSKNTFENLYEKYSNEKINISAAHSLYTEALSLCHLAKAKNYRDVSINEKAARRLYSALISPYNSIDYVNNDRSYNYNDVVKDLVTTFAASNDYLDARDAQDKIMELLMMSIENNRKI